MYDLDARVPAHQAAQLVGVSPQLVNSWKQSGKLKPCGKRGRSPLYRVADVLHVEASMRRSPQSHRAA